MSNVKEFALATVELRKRLAVTAEKLETADIDESDKVSIDRRTHCNTELNINLLSWPSIDEYDFSATFKFRKRYIMNKD